MKTIKCCDKICGECGFKVGGSRDTLYAEAEDMIEKGIIFPCHAALKAVSGDMSYGVEQLDVIEVCRGYVAFMKVNKPRYRAHPTWAKLMAEIKDSELDDICDWSELREAHTALREGVRLNNNKGLV